MSANMKSAGQISACISSVATPSRTCSWLRSAVDVICSLMIFWIMHQLCTSVALSTFTLTPAPPWDPRKVTKILYNYSDFFAPHASVMYIAKTHIFCFHCRCCNGWQQLRGPAHCSPGHLEGRKAPATVRWKCLWCKISTAVAFSCESSLSATV